ncbi:MAG TPA: NAD(P)/FAD-dependent oxidoreductase [Pyrinomonadaceae bacterium]|jgi:protoporphyrinogen oxidase|nr:NAD(P)/FAD-dependent oxidoreductase [Pyrinomonadaceae bacterium]
MIEPDDKRVIIIGGGPAGLTAAYELCKARVASVVLEKDLTVGGLSRTISYKGYHFDIGGHRFFTKVRAVDDLWREILPEGDFLRRKRLSRIYYDSRFLHYPLRFSSILFNIGIGNGLLILLSYLRAQVFPEKQEKTFEQWVRNRFGSRFYQLFFKTYTEKVWGIPCDEITSDWAAQRIKDLSLAATIRNLLFKQRAKDKGALIKTLIEEFDYPRRGPGMMWETMASLVAERGGEVRLGTRVESIGWSAGKVERIVVSSDGERATLAGSHFISSMPIRELVQSLNPPAPPEVQAAAAKLNYRDFITVALMVNRRDIFPDNWIYIHDPDVKMGRIQNFKNWSPHMVADTEKTCLGLEYFCFEGDNLWTMSDEELIELGKLEVEKVCLVKASEVEDAAVIRVPKAYPVYDHTYKESLSVIRDFLGQLENLQLVGRNGMHKYNNQDHSMLTAMLAVKNILGASYDLWTVNTEQEHLEMIGKEKEDAHQYRLLASTQPLVPERVQRLSEAALESEA